MHLVISTRADPPWQLARLRAHGEMVELRVEDLRFTTTETTTLLNSIMDFSLPAEDILALETRTEGWVVGIQLSSLSMRGRENKSGFVRSFTGSHRFILDYLIEQVLCQQPVQIQEFLLKTSILDRMTAHLCNAILKSNKSHDILKQLEDANLFVIPLDDERCWYRYHHLFLDLLRTELRLRHPDQLHDLHHLAIRWPFPAAPADQE